MSTTRMNIKSFVWKLLYIIIFVFGVVSGARLRRSSPEKRDLEGAVNILCTDIDCDAYHAAQKNDATNRLKQDELTRRREQYCFRRCFSELEREVNEIQRSGLRPKRRQPPHEESTKPSMTLKLNDALLTQN
jgi:hypothetical protein